jgi:hypothetical protein
MSDNCETKLNELLDILISNIELKDFEKTFLKYLKKSRNLKGKIYVIQKFIKRLKKTPEELFPDDFNKYTECIANFDLKLCEERFQSFIHIFLEQVKPDTDLSNINKNIITYLRNKKYVKMELMEKLVIYVILNDLIGEYNIYIENANINEISNEFNNLLERCKFRSHLGFI